MKREILLFAFCILGIAGRAQFYRIPVVVFDSMATEVIRGRACDSLQRAQAIEINAMLQELVLAKKKINLLEAQVKDSQEMFKKEQQQRAAEKQVHYIETKKKNKTILLLGGLSFFELVLIVALL